MALSNTTVTYLQDALTSVAAGNELANAIQNRLVLSSFTFNRLVVALTDRTVASNLQAAILGQHILSARDLLFMTDGLDSPPRPSVVADIVANLPVSPNTFPKVPVNVSMPSGFNVAPSYVGPAQQLMAAVTLPAGSTYPSFGPGAYFEVFTGGNTNQYYIWYNVSGGTNTDPTPIGLTGIEVTILSSDSASVVASKTNTALAALAAASTSVNGAVVTISPSPAVGTVALPVFSPVAGTYGSTQSVSLVSATAGATIYYTTNGSNPTDSSTLYSGPISVSVSELVKAVAVKSGLANSTIASAAYIIGGSQVATPTFSPIAGTYAGTQSVTVSSLTAGAAFYYTVDGSTPTTGSTLYSGPISVNQSETVKVLATHAGLSNSNIGSAAYTITALGPAAPNLGLAAGYRILTESGISDTSGSMITGAMGVSPIAHTAITGFSLTLDGSGQFSTAPNVTGDIYAADYSAPTPANLTTAISNMSAAYTDAQGRTTPTATNPGAGALGGLTLVPGLYKLTVPTTITGTLTLNGGVNDVWIFQLSSTLGLASSAQIVLTGGAQASNVYWAVAGAVTLGVSSVFRGKILAATNIACQTTSTVHGALYAQTAVTLDDVVVSN